MRWAFWRRNRPAEREASPIVANVPRGGRVRREWTHLPALAVTFEVRPLTLVPVLRLPDLAGTRPIAHRLQPLSHPPRRSPITSVGQVGGLIRPVPPVPGESASAQVHDQRAAGSNSPALPAAADPMTTGEVENVTDTSTTRLARRLTPVRVEEPTSDQAVAVRLPLTLAHDAYVAEPHAPETPYRSNAQIDRFMASLDSSGGDLNLAAMSGALPGFNLIDGVLTSVAEPPPAADANEPATRTAHPAPQVVRRANLAESRRRGLSADSIYPAEAVGQVADVEEPADDAAERTAQPSVAAAQDVVDLPAPPPSMSHGAVRADTSAARFDSPSELARAVGGEAQAASPPDRRRSAAPRLGIGAPITPQATSVSPKPVGYHRGHSADVVSPLHRDGEHAATARQGSPSPGTTAIDSDLVGPAAEQPVDATGPPPLIHPHRLSQVTVEVEERSDRPDDGEGLSAGAVQAPTASTSAASTLTVHVPLAEDHEEPASSVAADPPAEEASSPPWNEPPKPVTPVYRAALGSLPPRVDPKAEPLVPPGAVSQTELVPADLVASFRADLQVDVSDVVVHRGPAVTRAARSLAARAFTVGGQVFLPDDASANAHDERALLAHELVHAVQQRALDSALPSENSVEGMRLEAEAVAAEQWIRGERPVPPALVHRPAVRPIVPDLASYARAMTEQLGGSMTGVPTLQRADTATLSASGATPAMAGDREMPDHSVVPVAPVVSADGWSVPIDASHGHTVSWSNDRRPGEPEGGQQPEPNALHAAVARIDDLEHELADVRNRIDGRPSSSVDTHYELDQLAERLYRFVRARLRGELIVDRERAGVLTDFL